MSGASETCEVCGHINSPNGVHERWCAYVLELRGRVERLERSRERTVDSLEKIADILVKR